MWKTIKDYLVKYFPIILIVCVVTGIQLQSNSVQRRLLKRDINVLQSDLGAIKEEQRKLGADNAELIIYATKSIEWFTKYGQEIDKLGQFNTENRRELTLIRTDLRATKTELSTAITGLETDIGNIATLQGNATEDGKLYDEMERRLRELAERYGIDLTK